TGAVVGIPTPVGTRPTGVAITPDGTRAYITDLTGGTVSVIAIGDEPALDGTPTAGAVGRPYSHAFTLTGYPAPTVTVAAGSLPDGLTLTSDGELTGTPTTAGRFEFTLTATNSIGDDATLPVVLDITDSTPPDNGSIGSFGSLNWSY
ncbi:putative Ig domain-containing protein, partial [Prescottella defluvii]